MKTTNKILFLDNDGVVCLANNWGGRTKKWSKYLKTNPESLDEKDAPVEYRFDNFDIKAIKVLNEILEKTGAEIVVSSDWRKHASLEELGDYYVAQGISKRPIGVTKFVEECSLAKDFTFHFIDKYEQQRCFEIKQYLADNPEITHWVAVDDLDMGNNSFVSNSNEWRLSNFVRCVSINEGIKRSGLKEKIIKFLE